MKIIRKYVIIPIIVFIGLFGLFFGHVFFSSTICDDEYMSAYKDKMQLLETVASPRIIFVGDSNLAFTLDSQLIDKSLNYSPINMAMSLTIGLRYDLESIRPHIKSGDLIVISGVFDQFTTNSRYFNSDSRHSNLWGLIRINLDNIRWLTSIEQIENIVRANWKQTEKRIQTRQIISADCLYLHHRGLSREDFNQYGDFLGHLSRENPVRDFDDIELETAELDPVITQFINDFADFARNQGADVVFMYPAYAEGFWLTSQDKIVKFHQTIKRDYAFPILGHPANYYLTNDQLMNSAYHGTHEGRELRTKQVIEDLKTYLESRPTDYME